MNFEQWASSITSGNMETDAQYLIDGTRIGGAALDSEFSSALANKAFYQWSTFIYAFALMMQGKGYDCNDTSVAALEAVLANLQTNADNHTGMLTITCAASVTFNCAYNSSFYMILNQNCSATFINASVGQPLTIMIGQGSGGFAFSMANGLGFVAGPLDASSFSAQQFLTCPDGSIRATGPAQSS